MDPKGSKEKEETKETKDSGNVKESEDKNKGGLSYAVMVLVIIGLVLISVLIFKQIEVSKLTGQVVKLTEENKNLSSQSVSMISSLKNFYSTIKFGNVPFWEENNQGVVTAAVPLSSFTARKLGENVISDLGENAGNLVFKSVVRNQTIWTVVFVCKDDLNNTECGKQVVINEDEKTFSIQ